MKQIAIIGAGSWGTALAVIAAQAGHDVRLWSRNADVVSSINAERINSRYLSSTSIPEGVTATGDIEAALDNASIVLLATPSHAARDTSRSRAANESRRSRKKSWQARTRLFHYLVHRSRKKSLPDIRLQSSPRAKTILLPEPFRTI